jgi:hypothetical protein
MHYEINDKTFAISFYDGINPEPFQFQPDYPNLDKFDSYEEAETWAKLAIKSHDPAYGFYAPNGKGLAGEAKPTEVQILESKLGRTGLTVNDLKTLLGLE